MENSKITIEIKREETGCGVEYKFDVDVINPYYDDLIDFLNNIEADQSMKDDTNELIARMLKASDELFDVCEKTKSKQNNNYKRDSKGRFAKKSTKGSQGIKGSKIATDGSVYANGIIIPDLKEKINAYENLIYKNLFKEIEKKNETLSKKINTKSKK